MATTIYAAAYYALVFSALLVCTPSLCSVSGVPGLSFDYCSLKNIAGLELQGSATASVGESAVWLTPNAQVSGDRTNLVGRLVYSNPLRLGELGWSAPGARFETRFTFQLVTQPASYGRAADGLAFFLSSSPYIPSGSHGEYLGVQLPSSSSSSSSSNRFVAIEFDTYQNGYDPSASHVGLDVNTVVSVNTVDTSNRTSPFYLYGGYVFHARIEYDASDGHRISLWLNNGNTTADVFAQQPGYISGPPPLLVTSYDLSTIFGGGELLYVGLSASTGAAVEGAAIYSWAFNAHA